MIPSQNYRIHTKTIKRLRKFEKQHGLEPSISKTLEVMLDLIQECEES